MLIKPIQMSFYIISAIRAIIYDLLRIGRKQWKTIKELFCLEEVCTLRYMSQWTIYLVSNITPKETASLLQGKPKRIKLLIQACNNVLSLEQIALGSHLFNS